MQGLRNLVGNARAHAAVTLAGWLDVGKGISHTAYFDELPTHQELWWIINISMRLRKREYLLSWASMGLLGRVFVQHTGYCGPLSCFLR